MTKGSFRGVPAAGLILCALLAAATPGVARADTYDVTTRFDPPPGACVPGDCSLREAVIEANDNPGPDRIRLPRRDRPYILSIAGGAGSLEGDLDVSEAVRISTKGRGRATISAGRIDRVLNIQGGAPTALHKLKLVDGFSDGHGGLIRTESDLSIVDSILKRSSAESRGGAIYSQPAILRPGGAGGGDGARGSDIATLLEIRNTRIARASAGLAGGAIHKLGGDLLFKGSSVVGARSLFNGGAILVDSAVTRIADSKLIGNEAGSEAGAVDVIGGSMRLARSEVSGNRAGADGGAIFGQGELRIYASTIAGNTSEGNGGGIYVDDHFDLVNSTIEGNRADSDGGGLYFDVGEPALINAATIVRNVAEASTTRGGAGDRGGGIYNSTRTADGVIVIRNSILGLNRSQTTPNDCGGFDLMSFGFNLVSTIGPASVCEGLLDEDQVLDSFFLPGLADNGGPTPTIRLPKGSPARNAAQDDSSPGLDQRGVRRDRSPDIGAYER